MENNEVKIKGWAYKYELKNTTTGKKMYNFGLKFYNGKDKEGKSKYTFINCKGFDKDYALKDKQEVVVLGSLAKDEWKDKDGKDNERFFIFVNSVEAKDDMPF